MFVAVNNERKSAVDVFFQPLPFSNHEKLVKSKEYLVTLCMISVV